MLKNSSLIAANISLSAKAALQQVQQAFDFSKNERWIFWGILLLGVTLRFMGLRWGIPSALIPHRPFHPDEVWAMGVLGEADFDNWQFNAYSAHREGSLSFNLILFTTSILRFFGVVKTMPNGVIGYSTDYATILFTGRVLGSLFDSLSIIMVFLILKSLLNNKVAALTGAFIFAIQPFEIVYAHFMRSHVFANFFVLTTIYLSTHIYKSTNKYLYVFIGFSSGLAAASKYTSGLVICVPFLMFLAKDLAEVRSLTNLPKVAWAAFYQRRTRTIMGYFLIGFFLADPYLFLNFGKALPHIKFQASFAAVQEFSWANIFDLVRPWVYVKYLIPYGSLPYLWVVLYISMVYLAFQRHLYKFSIPLFMFFLMFFYPMSKGYVTPVYIRGAITLFPLFAILAGMAAGDWNSRILSRYGKWLSFCILLVITVPTIAYDFAYVAAMSREDPRNQLYNFVVGKEPTNKPFKVGVYPKGEDYFIIDPALDLLIARKTIIKEEATTKDMFKQLDYILLSAYLYGEYTSAGAKIQELSAQGFELVKTFENPLTFFGYEFKFPRNPDDLVYPFPTLYLLKPKASLSP